VYKKLHSYCILSILGFTKLSTKLDVESLKTHINNYFKDMLEIVFSYGGDVAKFAGDAMYVVWHAKSYSGREIAVSKAVACAKEIIIKCNNRDLSLSRTLSVNSRNSFMRMSLTQSISGESGLKQGNSFNTYHDNANSENGNALQSGATSLSYNVEPESRRSSTSSTISSTKNAKNKMRSLSLRSATPYALNNTVINDYDQEMEPGQMSLNVHIGISTGVMAGVDVRAEERSEFFLTGQPLLDVAAAESLSKLGEIVVSKSVFAFLIPHDVCTNYECVGGELECYRIIGSLTLSTTERNFKNGSAAEMKAELNVLLSMASNISKENNLRCCLLNCLGTHVHEAVRMLSHDCSSPTDTSTASNSVIPTSLTINDNSAFIPTTGSSSSPSRIKCRSDSDSTSILDNRESDNTLLQTEISSGLFLKSNSMGKGGKDKSEKCIEPDDSLSAELRELVVLFIKIDVDVTLFHHDSLEKSYDNQYDEAFKTDDFGFIERSEEDFTADVDLHERLEACMRILVETFAQRGGQIGQYSCGDKGNVCLGTFGLRGSVQQDNAAAAVECAQTIIVRIQAMNLNASIGVTSGKLYSGLLGSPKRHEYSIMGPSANLAARLMSAAAPGSVLCCKETRNRDRSHVFLSMPEVNAKGFPEPVITYQPVLSATAKMRMTQRPRSSFDESFKVDMVPKVVPEEIVMYGQNSDMNAIVEFFQPNSSSPSEPAQDGLKIAVIIGACGSGKTTFLAAVRDEMSKDPTLKPMEGNEFIFSGVSNMFDSTSPFASWKPVLVDLIAAVSKVTFPFDSLTERTYSRRSSMTSQAVYSPEEVLSLDKKKMTSRRTSFNGRTTRENSPASCFQSPALPYTSYSHLKTGTTLIIDALPIDVLPLLHLVSEVLPSFSKGVLPSVVESTYSGKNDDYIYIYRLGFTSSIMLCR
jgi:class 3 adenylate cyclase